MDAICNDDGAATDVHIDLHLERREAGIDQYLAELDSRLVGLRPVKSRIGEIASLLLVERVRERLGLAAATPTLHMSFTGNPGTGKTTVATTMAEILNRLGYLPTSRLLCVSRDDLVGEFIGHTGPKTREVLKRVAGGVLFIDEAYSLHRPENERDYGQEAIEILLQVMEDPSNSTVVILAGYADRMDRFFGSNPGFRSRIGHHIDFPDYTDDELVEIAELFVAERQYRFSPRGLAVMREYIRLRRQQPYFANARSIRNALDRARLRHASRQVTAGLVSIDDLTTIDDVDLLSSRVFASPLDT